MNRIIFVDIDGPCIPATRYLIDREAAWTRNFCPTCIFVLKKIMEMSGAKIVTNSTHNTMVLESGDLRKDLITAGIPEESFHDDWKTAYPGVRGENRRMDAIKDWLDRNGDHQWIALDDARFTDDERLVWVNPASGINIDTYNEAAALFDFKPAIIMM